MTHSPLSGAEEYIVADTEQLISSLEGMTVLELNSLVKTLEERWGVSAAAPDGGRRGCRRWRCRCRS